MNKRTKKWLYGTDKRNCKFKQLTSHDKVLTFSSMREANHNFEHRECGKNYEIVQIEVKIIGE
jgi:hypothetical protein